MTRVPFKFYWKVRRNILNHFLQRCSLSFFKEKLTFIRQPAPESDPCLLRALSKSQNWPAGPWPDQTFWQ